jgi:hypothetical protein
MLAFVFPSQAPAQVIRTSAGKRKDQQYYQGTDKKLTMRYPRLSVQRVYSCACQTFFPALVILPVSLSPSMAKYGSAIKRPPGKEKAHEN